MQLYDCTGFVWDFYGICIVFAWVVKRTTRLSVGKPGSHFSVCNRLEARLFVCAVFFKFLGVVEGRISTAFPSLSFGLHPGD